MTPVAEAIDRAELRRRLLRRANHCCERCDVRNYSVGTRLKDGRFVGLGGNGPRDAAGRGLHWPDLQPLTYQEARAFAEHENEAMKGLPHAGRCIVVVLTVGYLDHDPTNCADANLAALCQRDQAAHDLDRAQRLAAAHPRRDPRTLELALE